MELLKIRARILLQIHLTSNPVLTALYYTWILTGITKQVFLYLIHILSPLCNFLILLLRQMVKDNNQFLTRGSSSQDKQVFSRVFLGKDWFFFPEPSELSEKNMTFFQKLTNGINLLQSQLSCIHNKAFHFPHWKSFQAKR